MDLGPQAGLPSFPPSTSDTALAALTLKTGSACADETNDRQKARPSLSTKQFRRDGEGQLGWSLPGSVFAKAGDTQDRKILVNDGNSRTPRWLEPTGTS